MAILALAGRADAQTCTRTITADVVAFDQVFFWNRLGAVQPQGMMYALRRDVVPISGSTLSPGNVRLRADKRPRPIVLRMNVGDCLRIQFQNLLNPTPVDQQQPATREASIHVVGLEPVETIRDDGSNVGDNGAALSGLVAPGGSITYTLYAEREGEHVLHSTGAMMGGEGDGGQVNPGLFGAVNVEPAGARWYRSQVTRQDLAYAITGRSPLGQPLIDYEARYPAGHPRAGTPVLNMLDGTQIVHTDLTAIIAGTGGPRPGWFPAGAFPANTFTYPERHQPFREFTILYHDEIGAVQAFPIFEDAVFEHTLHSGRDAFAINYGTGGIGAEILANRFRVGPMRDCVECKYEEFFLTSWAVGDPAMVVDVPANSPCTIADVRSGNVASCTPTPGRKATKAFYPDDPANVYHGYLRDHTKFRVLHGGSKEHHIHHLHAHQWLFAADSDKSTYLDSQALGPGASFTAEITYHGGGNLNLTPGDAIFHCHFYPHFAQGMWSLWRVHDVLEEGTPLDEAGRPAAGSRALPDGEIAAGTPIPAVVPLPGKPIAPLPGASVSIVDGQAQVSGAGNPGYPFYIPAIAGHRPPKPPLDTIDDGGLPRHNIRGGTYDEAHTRLDFHKELLTADAVALPETGTPVEQAAMAFHAVRLHNSYTPEGAATSFVTNGQPAVAGAPYAEPCIDVNGNRVDAFPRLYKAADIEDDVKLNKAGWHFGQQRFTALWRDVDAFLFASPRKPPEPLFFRANSLDCIQFQLTNLVPHEYQLDDFQVRTPTDVLGQHIHLVKFDVTASDGAANGFNYEDGSFSPGEVRERIAAIREFNDCGSPDPRDGTLACPVARLHPFVPFQREEWRGAQTTVQRWHADPVRDNAGNDRTLRTVFTHDHFGPSTHQQAGLYAGLVVEKTNSTWKHNETGTLFYTRDDGGPTSWQAVIEGPEVFREFLLEFGDFQLAYEDGNAGFPDPDDAVNPPGRKEIGLPDLLARPDVCPGGVPPPCPEAISADDVGMMSVNYRNEPVALRVFNPATGGQASGWAGDLAFAFSSAATRADSRFNVQPTFYQPLTNDLIGRDPFTPVLRAYENDRVQVRVLVGAHEEGHNFSIHGVKWLFEPSEPDSGWRNSQMMGISEHFEFIVPQLIKNPAGNLVDRLWSAGSSTDDYWNGIWGLLRAYTGLRPDLVALSTNPNGRSNVDPGAVGAFDFSCPKDAPQRVFNVVAIEGQKSMGLYDRRITYNARQDGPYGKLFDPTAMLFVMASDLDATDGLNPNVPIEPLVLRARAGECVVVNLRNARPFDVFELDGWNTLPMVLEGFNANDIKPSYFTGLHPQLLYYDVSRYDGAAIGRNPNPTDQIALPGITKTYKWYAGGVTINPDGTVTATPIEFGAVNLMSPDRIEHASKGGFAALIVEPADATWVLDPGTRTAATVTSATAGTFREFVTLFQNDVNFRIEDGTTNGEPVPNVARVNDPEDSGHKAINYRSEPIWKRMRYDPETPLNLTRAFNFADVLTNAQVGADPQTPVFTAAPGQQVRFRVLHAGGHSRNIVLGVHGHIWDREPYINNSTRLGRNGFSMWEGAHMGVGPSNHFDMLLRHGAGGKFSVGGDFLFRDHAGPGLDGGLWGLLRVEP